MPVPSKSTPAAEPKPHKTDQDQGDDADEEEEEDDDDDAGDDAPQVGAKRPVLNPFAKSTQQMDGQKSVLDVGTVATPSTVKTNKRKGAVGRAAPAKKVK